MRRSQIQGMSAVAAIAAILCIAPVWAQEAEEFSKPPEVFSVGDAARATGGPDAFGYTFIDSTEAGGPAYSYVDVSSTGSIAIQGYSDDSVDGPFPIGFTFNFYGVDYTEFWVQTNGTIGFASFGYDYGNECMPTTDLNSVFIAPLWDDLVCGSGPPGTIFYETLGTAPNRTLVIQYNNVRYIGGSDTDPIEFEVILYEGSNDVLMQYADLINTTSSHNGGVEATIGIEGNSVDYYLEYACNPATALPEPLAVLFTLGGVAADVDLAITKTSDAAGSVVPGVAVTYTIAVTNQSATDGATGVFVTDTLPTNVTYASDTCGGVVAAGVWTWSIGSLAAGVALSCDLAVTVNPDATGSIENTVVVAGNETDPNIGDNTDLNSISLQGPAIPALRGMGVMIFILILAASAVVAIRRFA